MRDKLIAILQSLDKPTRANLRKVLPDKEWVGVFGNFSQFKLAAGLGETRLEKQYYKQIANCDSNYELNKLNEKKIEYSEKYLRPNSKRFQTVLVASDFHGTLCDPFLRKCFIDTAYRTQADIILLNGDIIDCEEFSTHGRNDPRRHRLIEEFNWLDKFLCDLREVCPDSQITYISGNHSNRILRHLASESPFIRELLADFHGFNFAKLLGIDKYQVNFVSKDDLTVYRETAVRKEVAKNYVVLHDCLIIGHEPTVKKHQMNSIHGHLHQLTLQNGYSYSHGQYQHLGLGCMCKVDAHYAGNVDHWNQSFCLAHIDTVNKGVQFEIIDCSNNSVMIGGKFMLRDEA